MPKSKSRRKTTRPTFGRRPRPAEAEPQSALWPDEVLFAWLCEDPACGDHEPSGGRQ